MNKELTIKLLITAGLFGLVAVASTLNKYSTTETTAVSHKLDYSRTMFTGRKSTIWHNMSDLEKGWIGGMVIASAAGPFGYSGGFKILEMKAARSLDENTVVACGRLQHSDKFGIFSVLYDPATFSLNGHVVYRIQDDIMSVRHSVETEKMVVSPMDSALIMADCKYVGLL